MKKIILLTAIVGFFFTACKKEDDNPEPSGPQYTTQEINLTKGATKIWKLTNTHIYGENELGQVFDQDLQLQSCAFDNRYTFTIEGDYTSDTGDEKCDPSEEQTVTGKWEFIDNQTFLWNDKEMEIVTLTENEFTVSYTAYFDLGVTAFEGLLTNTYIPE